MSRIGKEPVKLADGVTAMIAGQKVTVKGTLVELSSTMQGCITAKVGAVGAVVNFETGSGRARPPGSA